MKHIFGKTAAISLGGSVVCPDDVDSRFVREFRRLVERCTKRGMKFLLVVGGGSTCRKYQRAAKEIGPIMENDLDWIGIHATRLNASLVRAALGKLARPFLIEARGAVKKLTYPVTVGGGWKPGWSTDFVTAVLAHDFGCREIINIGKPAFVYDKNPDAHKDAQPIREMRWREYRAQMPRRWIPGFHAPVDPVAAKFCEQRGITMLVVGADLKNLASLLKGKEFEGTIIQ